MKLVSVDQYRNLRFSPESRPAQATVKRWIIAGHIPGRKIGSKWYVDIEAEQMITTGDELVDHILSA